MNYQNSYFVDGLYGIDLNATSRDVNINRIVEVCVGIALLWDTDIWPRHYGWRVNGKIKGKLLSRANSGNINPILH